MPQHVKSWLAPLALAVMVSAAASEAEAQSPTLITSTALYASVKANGTLASSNGVVSSQNLGFVGEYEVIFNRNVTTCAFLGTIGSSATSGSVTPGEITVVGRNGNPNGVFVSTHDSNGTDTGRPFMLSVYCP